jgi:hypothetical protein
MGGPLQTIHFWFYLMEQDGHQSQSHSQKSWAILLMNIHKPNRIPNKHMMTINFDTITNNYEVIFVI